MYFDNISVTTCRRKLPPCGINSGAKVDKSGLLDVFYGDFNTAPMIVESPVNLECRLAEAVV